MESVLETYDYSKFKFKNWNRDIKEKNLRKIDKKVKAEGWKKHPIIVNEKNEIIDGQHRLFYAKQHGYPVYYIVVPGLTVTDCVDMNNVRTSWTMEDYIKLYSSQKNENYIRLKQILADYNFAPVSTMTGLIKNTTSNLAGQIRGGTFTLTEKECRALKSKFDFLQELSPYINAVKGRLVSIHLALAFCYDLESVNNARLKKQVKSKIASIIPPVDLETALKEIEYIYNYKIKQEDYAYIVTEYKKYVRNQRLKTGQNLLEKNLQLYGSKNGKRKVQKAQIELDL